MEVKEEEEGIALDTNEDVADPLRIPPSLESRAARTRSLWPASLRLVPVARAVTEVPTSECPLLLVEDEEDEEEEEEEEEEDLLSSDLLRKRSINSGKKHFWSAFP